MKVKWHERAKRQRNEVADYIGRQFSAKRKHKFKQEVRETTQRLKRSPYIGQIDPLFADRAKTYRSVIVNGLNKIVYYIEGDTIRIAGFWDTRMDDEGQAARVE